MGAWKASPYSVTLAGVRGPQRSNAIVKRLLDWFAQQRRDLPWRRTRDPYAIWVSEVMLQQTQVQTVIPYWERWIAELPDVQRLAGIDESRLLKLWEGLGYYRRARHLQAAARVICDQFGGVFPREFEQVLALPGIGRYTAGAICSIAFDQPTPVVDGNVVRVLSRLGAVEGDPRSKAVGEQFWDWAADLVKGAARTGQADACSHFNQAMMELGALICTPRRPECARCPVASVCQARIAGDPERFPRSAPRSPATSREFVVIVAQCGERYCVRQRAAEGVNGGLWEFPNVECPARGSPTAMEAAMSLFGDSLPSPPQAMEPESLGEVRHSITRYRIRQRVFRLHLARRGATTREVGQWKTLDTMRALPFTAAHGRILRWLR